MDSTLYTILILAFFIFGFLPAIIASANNHPKAGLVGVMGLLGVFIWPLWIAAVIWAFVGGGESKQRYSGMSGVNDYYGSSDPHQAPEYKPLKRPPTRKGY